MQIAQSDQMKEESIEKNITASMEIYFWFIFYIRVFAFEENFDASVLKCTDPMLCAFEEKSYETLTRSTFSDDYIVEPWMMMQALYQTIKDSGRVFLWGLGEKPQADGAVAYVPFCWRKISPA